MGETISKRTLYIVLEMDDGKEHNVTLLDPKDELAMDAVISWADSVIQKQAIIKDEAQPTSLIDSYIKEVKRTDLEPAA